MKKLALILLSAIFYSCISPVTEPKSAILEQPKPLIAQDFDFCFSEPTEETEVWETGCAAGYYKYINDQYVLRIVPKFRLNYNECVEMSIDSTTEQLEAELILFEKGEAHLTNYCTDLFVVNIPKPIETLKAIKGKLAVGQSDPTPYGGVEMPRISIRVDSLLFMHPATGEKIEIKNKLFWKVLNLGMPG